MPFMARIVCLKTNKRTNKQIFLKTVRQLINHFREKQRTHFRVTGLEFKFHEDSYNTKGTLSAETNFDIYHIEFPNAFDGANFLRRHQICSMEEIIQATEPRLQRALFDRIMKDERRRIKRKTDYDSKVSRHVDL